MINNLCGNAPEEDGEGNAGSGSESDDFSKLMDLGFDSNHNADFVDSKPTPKPKMDCDSKKSNLIKDVDNSPEEASPYLSPNPADWPPLKLSRLQMMEDFDPGKESITAWKRRKFFRKKESPKSDDHISPQRKEGGLEGKGEDVEGDLGKEDLGKEDLGKEDLGKEDLGKDGKRGTLPAQDGIGSEYPGTIKDLFQNFQTLREQLRKDLREDLQQITGSAPGTALIPIGQGKGLGKEEGEEDGTKEPKVEIVCLAKGDYIKKLIQLHDGDEEKAMNYIKNVGIATDFLEGDFRLIKKLYFDGKKKSEFPIRIKDFKRNKLEYLEENGEWVLDIRGEIVGKRLCDNIVSTLLIANTHFNEVIINETDDVKKELLLDLFQINKTQAHILKLTERKTQCKLSRRVAEFINYCTEVQAETGSLENVKKAYS